MARKFWENEKKYLQSVLDNVERSEREEGKKRVNDIVRRHVGQQWVRMKSLDKRIGHEYARYVAWCRLNNIDHKDDSNQAVYQGYETKVFQFRPGYVAPY